MNLEERFDEKFKHKLGCGYNECHIHTDKEVIKVKQFIKAEIEKALDEVVPEVLIKTEYGNKDFSAGHNNCRQEVLDKIKQIKEKL